MRAEQWVPHVVEDVFEFFRDPHNLERLTPPFLHFDVRRASTPTIGQGTRLWYRLRLHGIPLWWRTHIETWQPPYSFTDEQEIGPYRRWSHRHQFVPADGGTLIRDEVDYELWLEALMPSAITTWVERDVRRIFEYRQHTINSLYGTARPDAVSVGADKG